MTDETSLTIEFGGETLCLLGDRAVFWPKRRILILSDVHFAKSASFRAQGIPVPEGECRTDLDRITALVSSYACEKLIIVGDFFHSSLELSEEHRVLLEIFCESLGAEILLIRGNHDPLRQTNLPMIDRYFLAPFEFVHEPSQASKGEFTITGHLHPLYRLEPRVKQLRVPCFLLSEKNLSLPAFGTFTAGQVIQSVIGQTVFPIANRKVFHLPVA